ncbi:MAG: glyoxalase, partial [Betaproteobacteria bacterium]
MSYSLTLSHVGIYVVDMPRMVDFYSGYLGFAVSDRGPARGGGEIVFMTRDPREHHQFVLANGRPADLAFNLINQLSFRVDSLDTLRELHRGLANEAGVKDLGPTCHGNAVSVYFH